MDKLTGWINKVSGKGNPPKDDAQSSSHTSGGGRTSGATSGGNTGNTGKQNLNSHTAVKKPGFSNMKPQSNTGGKPHSGPRPQSKSGTRTAPNSGPKPHSNNKPNGSHPPRSKKPAHSAKPSRYQKGGFKRKPADAKGDINSMRLKNERKTPTTPSKPVNRKSVARHPEARKQRPRPMLGVVNRAVGAVDFPQHEKFPEGTPMRVIPLGGLNEVGKNSMAIEYDGDIVMIDIGLQFPEENMPGIDYVIPDLSYVIENKHKLKGVLITHGHLDHIGAIHHYIEKLGFPTLYATRLTKALIEKRLEEHKLLDKVEIILIDPEKAESRFQLGKFTVNYFRVNHSIPDATGIFLKTDAGSMVHTGDFKFDMTPADGQLCDYKKMAELAEEGVDIVFADSTNATKKGFCPSERLVFESIERVMQEAAGKRLIMATFASSIGRHQAIITNAVKYGRKIFLGGRSMNDNLKISHELGIIDVPRSAIRKLDNSVNDYRPEEVLVLTTGSQGEPFAALSRISRDEHPFLKIDSSDIIAFSSSPIPGNERSLYTVIDSIYRKGARVITKLDLDIHASGHAYQGDLQMMHTIMKTKYVAPIHGEYFMRIAHRNMVINEMQFEPRNVVMAENGSIVEVLGGVARKAKERVDTQLVFVDGKDHADMTEKQLKERLAMAEGGLLTVLLELDKTTKKLVREPRTFTEGFLENANVHGVIVDTTKKAYEKLLSKHHDKIKEDVIIEDISHELTVEMLREVAREPVIQVIVTLV